VNWTLAHHFLYPSALIDIDKNEINQKDVVGIQDARTLVHCGPSDPRPSVGSHGPDLGVTCGGSSEVNSTKHRVI